MWCWHSIPPVTKNFSCCIGSVSWSHRRTKKHSWAGSARPPLHYSNICRSSDKSKLPWKLSRTQPHTLPWVRLFRLFPCNSLHGGLNLYLCKFLTFAKNIFFFFFPRKIIFSKISIGMLLSLLPDLDIFSELLSFNPTRVPKLPLHALSI